MKSSHPPVYFGEWVKQRRKMLDLTQEELARKSGCSVFALRKIESGDRRPSKQLAELLAKSLEIPSEEKQSFIRTARGELSLERLNSPTLGLPTGDFSSSPPSSYRETRPSLPGRNIPHQLTPLIGREAELAAMGKIFKDPQCRLLTLTGVGGIGKTRLAIEFAARECSAFPGGVFYISLTAIISLDKIASAIADVLEFSFSGPVDPREQLLHFISTNIKQEALFILDNLEHLLVQQSTETGQYGVVELVSEILQRLPGVKILATSRERMNLYGEWMYELHGLSVPPSNIEGLLEEYDSSALFIKSAQRMKADFQISRDDREALVRICQLVEGVPLAIELAAAWVGIVSCQEIAHEIRANMDFLTTSMREIPARHRSIRATFNHSWNLLSDEERGALCQLAVFRGGFDRKAAYQIAGASLTLLASLNAKSLVRHAENGRYDLHEVIRQYALSYLNEHQGSQETCERHCEYYLVLVQDRENSLKSASQQETFRQLADEIDNIRAAWSWAIHHKKIIQLGGAGRAFGWYFEIAGLYREGIEQLELLVNTLKDELQDYQYRRILGLALVHQGLLYLRKGEFDHARTRYEEGITVLRPISEQALLADALIFLAIIVHLNGDFERARSLVEEGLSFAQAGHDRWFEALAFCNLGYISSLMGRYAEGYEQMMAGLAIWRTIGDPHAIALGMNYVVPTLIGLNRPGEARALMQESIALCEQSKNRWGMGTAYRFLGLAALAEGQFSEAQGYFRKSLEIFGEYIVGWDIARTLSYLGEATMLAGDLPEAREIYLNALLLAVQVKAMPIALDSFLGLAQIFVQTGETISGLRLSDYVLNHAASTQETKDRARRLYLEAKPLLTEKKVESALQWPDNHSIESILEILLSERSNHIPPQTEI
jgi:predicted ATPase/transcriptional regulator with XRE-family HTH domain